MEKIIKLKIGTMMLFWFGVIFQSIVILGFNSQFVTKGYVEELTVFGDAFPLLNVINFSWLFFAHVMHIVSGYFLSKGSTKGAIFAIIVCGWETIGVLILSQSDILTVTGIVIRMYFVIILFLIISGRKDLSKLQTENWRPWKDPRTN